MSIKQITITLDEEVLKRTREFAKKTDRKISSVITIALKQILNEGCNND